MTKTLLKSGLAVGAAVAISGCASNSKPMQSDVEQAMNKAESAQQTANTALKRANSAQDTAQQAQSTAQANSDRMERMFKKSQQK